VSQPKTLTKEQLEELILSGLSEEELSGISDALARVRSADLARVGRATNIASVPQQDELQQYFGKRVLIEQKSGTRAMGRLTSLTQFTVTLTGDATIRISRDYIGLIYDLPDEPPKPPPLPEW